MKNSKIRSLLFIPLFSLAITSCSSNEVASDSSASASPSASQVQIVMPISLPVAQNGEITFDTAVDLFAKIPETSWNNIQNVIEANQDFNVPTTIEIGPNTDTTAEQITEILNKNYRLWNGFQQPPSFAALAYNAKDEAWAETQWPIMAKKLNLTENPEAFIPNELRAGCAFTNDVATECYGGMALTFENNPAGFAFFGVQSPFWAKGSTEIGPISQVAHEYTHIVQFTQWNGVPLKAGENLGSDAAHNGMPCWFSEGQPNAIGIAVAATNFEAYLKARDNSVRRKINQDAPIKPSLSESELTAEKLTEFLYGQDVSTCYDPGKNGDWQFGYSLGYAATETLIAIGGPQATMALLVETASGKSWSEAFQNVYGVSWEQGSEVLGKVLAQEYAAKPMDH